MEKWIGRVALVTGASAGFGESIAKRLVEHGMKVVGCARNIEKIQSLSESLKGSKGSLTAIKCDIAKEEEILAMFERIKKELGGVDVCINNAGLSHNAPLLTGTTEQWRNMLDVNVLGLCICSREAVKSMRERGVDDGHIVLMSSMSGHRVVPNASHIHFYAATKFAVKALTEGLRNEVCEMKSHIRVTSISPGLAKTEFSHRLFKDEVERADKRYSGIQAISPGMARTEFTHRMFGGDSRTADLEYGNQQSVGIGGAFQEISPGMARTEFNHRMWSDEPERADKIFSLYKAMTADDVTDSVMYALSAPTHVQVHDILIRPTECPY